MNTFRIAAAQATDWAEVVDLLATCNLPHEDLSLPQLAGFRIFRQGTALEGVVGLERFGTSGLLRSLGVAPASRGQKLGSRLVASIEASAGEKGLSDLYLLTTTAAEFFARLGYRSIARTHAPDAIQATAQFTNLCPASAICMRKELGVVRDT